MGKTVNLSALNFLRTLEAVDDFPVPTGPTQHTGKPRSNSVPTKKLYRSVSTVGTIIL